MKFLILTVLSIIISSFAQANTTLDLSSFITANEVKVQTQLSNKFEYSFNEIVLDPKKCVSQESEIGAVGVCLVTLDAKEEPVSATFAITVSSHHSGTSVIDREINIVLIDYKL